MNESQTLAEPAEKEPRYEQVDWNDRSLLLALDESWIAKSEGKVKFALCPLQKEPAPVMFPDKEWEGGGRAIHQDPFVGHVLRDVANDRYALWYSTKNNLIGRTYDPAMGNAPAVAAPGGGSQLCFATSRDGLVWKKPNLGLVSYFADQKNNMVPLPGLPLLNESVNAILPTRHAGARYPLAGSIFSRFHDPIYSSGITQIWSHDGFSWDLQYPPTIPLDGDAHAVMWDPETSSYLCTTRSAQHTRIAVRALRKGHKGWNNKRHVALARSRDLIHWTPMLDILDPDAEDPPEMEFYRMYIIPYGNLRIGLLQTFLMKPGMTGGPLEIQLAISRDLENWTRAGRRQAFIPRGEPGSWDCAHVIPTHNPPFREGDRLRFWYGGKNTEHWQEGNTALGTGTLRVDGFACWKGTGVLETAPLDLRWASWPMVNVDATHGTFEIEVVDAASGKPIEGMTRADFETITGNHLRAECRFRGHYGSFWRHTGRVVLRMYLRDATFYALRAPNLTISKP
jgi:hypothetical protein